MRHTKADHDHNPAQMRCCKNDIGDLGHGNDGRASGKDDPDAVGGEGDGGGEEGDVKQGQGSVIDNGQEPAKESPHTRNAAAASANEMDSVDPNNTVYVKNLLASTTEEELNRVLGAYGEVTSSIVFKDCSGNSKCCGLVQFLTPESAFSAIGQDLNIAGKVWSVERALTRDQISKKYQNRSNLYVKNFDDGIDDQKLEAMFSEFGSIASCKVMVDINGVSRGFGFVAFSTPEEAAKAVQEMNGKTHGSKQLYVGVAEPKEQRQAKLRQYFSTITRPLPIGAPRPMMAPQMGPRFGFRPQLLPPRPGCYYGPVGPNPRSGFRPHFLPPHLFRG